MKNVVIIAAAFGLCSAMLSAEPNAQDARGFRVEGGAEFTAIASSAATTFSIDPRFTFYFSPVKPDGRPIEEIAFLERIGYAKASLDIFSQRQDNDPTGTEGGETKTLGAELSLHWVWDVLQNIPYPMER